LRVHRGAAHRGGRAAPRRHDHPRPARRPRRQRTAVGHQRGAEGSGPRRAAVTGQRVGGRRRARPAARCGGAARLGGHRDRGGARRGPPLVRPGLLRPGQRVLPAVGCHQPGPGAVRRLAGGGDLRRPASHRGRRPHGGEVMSAAPDRAPGGEWRPEEMMTIAAARALAGHTTCFVGIGAPSTAANLARRLHAPDLVLIYESGTIGARPRTLPLSIGDGELAETAQTVVSVPEMFNYWLQAGRIHVGFLGAAQLDRYANINTTVIGPDYRRPRVRLPGAGGAPEIAASCHEIFILVRHSRRTFVDRVDFVTSVGYGDGPGARERLGLRGRGPVLVVTDLGVLEPDPHTCELTLTRIHPGVDLADVRAATGWDLAVREPLQVTEPPTTEELELLRSLTQGSLTE